MNVAKKNTGYLINGIVEFWPEKRCLQRRDNPQKVVLYSPANACLLKLIRKKSNIVNQKDLMMAGWEERGEYVTPNTFYQSILTLRQALEEIGLGKKFIMTVRRRGLMINDRFNIMPIGQEEAEEMADSLPAAPYSPLHLDMAPKIPLTTRHAHKLCSQNFRVCSISVVFFITLICAFMWLSHDINNGYFSKYKKLDLLQDCNIFVSTNSINHVFYQKFIQRNNLQCDKRNWWYITAYHNSPRIFLTRCIHDIENAKDNYCTSDVYYGRKKDVL